MLRFCCRWPGVFFKALRMDTAILLEPSAPPSGQRTEFDDTVKRHKTYSKQQSKVSWYSKKTYHMGWRTQIRKKLPMPIIAVTYQQCSIHMHPHLERNQHWPVVGSQNIKTATQTLFWLAIYFLSRQQVLNTFWRTFHARARARNHVWWLW